MDPLPAASTAVPPTQYCMFAVATAAMGIACGGLSAAIVGMLYRATADRAETWDFENARRLRLRGGSLAFRWFEPLIEEIKSLAWLRWTGRIDRVRKNLAAGGDPLPWMADEYIAARIVEACLAGVALGGFSLQVLSLGWSAFVGVATVPVYFWWALAALDKSARGRLLSVRRRLPFAVDLMALMMEAGAGFRDALTTVAAESEGHPLGRELTTVRRGLERGQTLRQALTDLRDRLQDPDVGEFVAAVVRAEELGSPLGRTLLTMADQMRLRRSQWAEKVAGEAQAKITAPGMVIMVASMLVVLGPFLLQVARDWPF